MSGRIWLGFFITLMVLAFTVRTPVAQEIPCVSAEEGQIFEPKEYVKGYGIRDGALIKLSVSSEGNWLLTLSPPEMSGAVCIVFMGTDWHFVTSKTPDEKVSYGRSD